MISRRGSAGRPGRVLGILALLAVIPMAGLAIALDAARKGSLSGKVVNACLAMMETAWSVTERHLSATPLTTLAILMVAGSVLWAVLRTILSVVNTRRLLHRSDRWAGGHCGKLDGLLMRPQFRHLGLRLLDSTQPLAFTVGFWNPQVVLSKGMVSALSPAELSAVLSHELGHVRSRDPLRLAVVRFLADALWFLPVARSLAAGFADAVEAAADDWAVGITRRPVDLASALVKTAKAGVPQAIQLAPSLAGHLTVEDRVKRLLGLEKGNRRKGMTGRWVASGFISALLFALLILPHAGGRYVSEGGVAQAMMVRMPMMACHVSGR